MKKFLTIALLTVTIIASACWFTATDWGVVYIASINDTDLTPVFGTFPTVTVPAAGTQNLPATITMKVVPSITNGTAIIEALMVWKYASGTRWKILSYRKDFSETMDYTKPLALFGRNNFNPPGVQSGDSIMGGFIVRDIITSNADIDISPTPTGVEGNWQFQYRFIMTVGTVRR